nr:hypothetical protein [Escherichia coli]
MKSGKYTKSCFVNHASWEYEMIEKNGGITGTLQRIT